MKIDGFITAALADAGSAAAELEAAGYTGAWSIETSHDPFFPLVLAATQTTDIDLATGIAVAFARNPMTLANIGWDLQSLSKGRLIIGLGSQIKPHITKRFSMPWSHPAPRMRELILAMRAIWDTWLTGAPLQFRGEFYSHTLMTPFFTPHASDLEGIGVPRVFLAGVGPMMTEVAGEVCDGFLCHAFTTERYFREVTLPALERGRHKAGATMDGFEISGPSFIVTGASDDEIAAAAKATREQIAFYGSTPAYRPVLDMHGWGSVQDELNALSKQGDWAKMGELITDEMLDAFAIVGPPESIAPELQRRYGDAVDRISLYTPYRSDPDRWGPIIAAIKAI